MTLILPRFTGVGRGARRGEASLFRTWVAPLAVALAWTLLLRLPFRNYSHPDDGFFAEAAWLWLRGAPPYLHVFDIKPPGFLAALALSQMFFGPTLAASHTIGALSGALSAASVFFIARRHGAPRVGLFAAALLPLLLRIVAQEDAYEFLIAATTLAMAFALSGIEPIRRAALSGLSIGVACATKQTAIFEAASIAAILLSDPGTVGRRGRAMFVFASGASAAPLVAAAYFAAHGALGIMLTDIVGVALSRPGAASDGVTWLGGVGHLLELVRDCGPLFPVATATAIAQLFISRPRPPLRSLSLWFAFALAGVIFQHALMSCYLAPLLSPALLLAGFGVVAILPKERSLARWAPWALCGMAAVEALVAARLGATAELIDRTSIDGAAAVIRGEHPGEDDRLFIVNAYSNAEWIYSVSGVTPVSPYLIPTHMLCDFPTIGPRRIKQAMAARPRFVVVSGTPFRYLCELPGAHEITEKALRLDYRLLARVGAGKGSYDIYEIAQ